MTATCSGMPNVWNAWNDTPKEGMGKRKARSRGVAHSLGKIVSYLTEDWDELKVQQRVRLKTTGPATWQSSEVELTRQSGDTTKY